MGLTVWRVKLDKMALTINSVLYYTARMVGSHYLVILLNNTGKGGSSFLWTAPGKGFITTAIPLLLLLLFKNSIFFYVRARWINITSAVRTRSFDPVVNSDCATMLLQL